VIGTGTICHVERTRALASLTAALNSAVGPAYAFWPNSPRSQHTQ
jgi:hypothetical protein